MNTKFSRPEKPKGKFAQSNINLLYKGNASETRSRPTIRSSGYQVVGKLQKTRCNPPPPPWVPSIKAEMGGQDIKVNIVPPGGSGWGTGPSTSNNESSSSPPKNDFKDAQSEAPSSILKSITENSPQDNAEETKGSVNDSDIPLVKPPQKPFFELRSQTAVVKPPEDLSTEIVRPLSGKNLAPMVPFYQRPSALASTTMQDADSSAEGSKEGSPSPTPLSKPVATTRSSGWASVASEEPDFQERIAFSEDDDDSAVSKNTIEEPVKKLPSESLGEHPSPIKPLSSSASVSETPWAKSSLATTSQVSFTRAAWEQSHSSFLPVSSMSPQLSYPVSSYCAPRNDVLFPEDMLATTRVTDVSLLSEQLQRSSFTNTSEAQVQAQREERTLAYKSAVNRAQMARKKRSDEQQTLPLEPTSKRNDQSMDSVKSALADVNVFPPTFMHPPHGPSPYSTIPPAVNHSPQHTVESVFAPLYSGGLPNIMGNGFVPPPPQAMKPQVHLSNTLSASTWNPHGSFSASNSQAFMHPSYPLSNSPKMAPPPTNQGPYFKSDSFTAVYPQPSISKPEHSHHHHPVESVMHSFANPMGSDTSINHLTGFQPPKPLQQQQSNSSLLEKRLDNEAGGGKDLLNSLSAPLGSHAPQISTHTDATRITAFTVPPVVDSSCPQTSTAISRQPQHAQPSTSHITPLMEVSLSGKWSEKDFEEVFENASHGAYSKPFKSGRGGGARHYDDQVRRCGGFTPNAGRPLGGRGGAKRQFRPRPPNTEGEGEESYEEGKKQQYGNGEHDSTFLRSQQQRSRGGNNRGGVLPRSNRDHENDNKQSGMDYEHGEKWKSSGYKSNRHGGESGGVSEKANSIASAGSGLGRKTFSRSGPSYRRFDGNDGTSKSSPRSNFSTNQRKQTREIEDNASGDCATSMQNESEKLDTNAVQSDIEQPEGSTPQTHHSQRPHRGGGGVGRGHRGFHSGSQRQSASQRRDHRVNQNQPRGNQQNNNPRRHPDDDNDNHGTSSNSNNNAATSTTTVTTTDHSSTSKGEITGNGNSNESGGGQQHNHQQQSGNLDTLGTGSSKSRSHAHSVTLASDVGDVWETASEGFSSSLMGTSPGCSFADCATVRTYDNDDDNIIEHNDVYGKRPNAIQRGRRPIPSAPNVGKIIPLMSINAEAPPSFVNNPNFLDSPPPSPPPPPVQKSSTKIDIKGERKDVAESNVGEEQSAVGSFTDSSEDGFQEVKSKSARRQQQKAKQQQKSLKSSSSNDEKSSNGKSKSRDATANAASSSKSRVQGTSKGISEQQKHSKCSVASKKGDEKDKQQQTRSANVTTTTSWAKSSAESGVTKKALPIGPSKNPPPSAWLKPLQETINEKAAALASAQQQRNAKSVSASKVTLPTTSVVSSIGSVNSTVPVASSSYAWSVVVGSRTTTTASNENAPVSTPTTTLPAKVAGNKVAVSKPIQHSAASTIPVSGESKPPPNQASIALVSESQSKTTASTATTGDKKGEGGLPVSVTTTVAPSSTSAIVCKVLPQKQPECSAAAANSSVVTVAPSTRSESSATFTSNVTSNNPVPAQLTSNQPLSFRRPPLSDVGDWLCVGKANAPTPLFLDSYNPGKKMDNTMAQDMSSVFMQHQQQSFRQQQQQAMAPPQLMNFSLHELTLRNHQGSLRDNYFTSFSGGGNNGSQQRNIYTPQQKGGAAGWQTASWQPPPQPAQAAHFEPNGLWPSNYNTPPPQPPPASYVGVIGADRPSTSNSVATQQHQSRLQQSAAAAAHAAAFAAASIYGRGGGVGANGAGQQPYPQPHPQPGGLYAQSQSQQQTPPPHLSFDPNFAYSNGGLAANSTSLFSHHHQSSGGPALLAPHQRQNQLVNSAGASGRDHPPPPMFINAAVVSHGTPYPPPTAAVIPAPGLHY
nr:BAT2 N terminal [Hymenolepis microstoma]